MALREGDDSKRVDKKQRKIEIRDLKPKKETKGGAGHGDSQNQKPVGGTGEIDFMTDFDK